MKIVQQKEECVNILLVSVI